MRIARYDSDGAERLGIVSDDGLQPLPEGTNLLDLLAAEPEERDRIAREAEGRDAPVPLTEARLLAPLRPSTLRDFVVFEEHVEGVAKSVSGGAGVPETWYEIPTFYFGNPYSVVGPYDPVAVPPGCEALDFELEVAAIIGKAGHDLTPEEARGHIAGYTILNDWSARDLQRHEMRIGLGPAKGKDFANTLGPWIVTADELEPYHRDDRFHLNMEVSVNGEHFGDDTLANMAWSFEELVAYASRGTWVRPGDVLGTGTCGSGALAELWGRNGRTEPPPLAVGDVVKMTVEGIGVIENRVVEGVLPVPIPRARPAGHRRERAWGV